MKALLSRGGYTLNRERGKGVGIETYVSRARLEYLIRFILVSSVYVVAIDMNILRFARAGDG